MWRLLRDQLERDRAILLTSGVIFLFCCVGLTIFLAPGRTRNLDWVSFVWVLLAYNVVSMGIWLTPNARGHLRVLRAVPVASAEADRALWLGVVTPGLVPGAFACVLAGLLYVVAVRFGSPPFSSVTADGVVIVAVAVVWGSGMTAVVFSLLLATNRLQQWALIVLCMAPGILPLAWASPPRGTSLVSVEQAALVCLGAVFAMTSFLLCPRLLAGRHRTGTGTVSRRRARVVPPERHDLAAPSPALEQVARMVGVAVAVGAVAIPTAWMLGVGPVVILYAQCFLPLTWLIRWRPAARALRSLPLSSRRLVALPLAAVVLSSLAGSLVVVGVAVAMQWLVVGSLLWLLPFCAGLSSLIGSAHVRWGGRPEIWVGLCSGFFALLFPLARWVGPSTVFWLGVVGGPTLAVLGYLILRRGLALTSTPYRGVPTHP